MERREEKTFCCGAGGAHMWMEERAKPINEERVRQAAETGAGTLAVACPFCTVMLDDGVKSSGRDMRVVDLATLLAEAWMTDYAIVNPDEVRDAYAGTDVPGEFRRLTDALGCEQLAVTLIRVPPHSDFEQGTGHFHDEVEELYLVTRGTLTMRFGDEIREVQRAGRGARRPAHAALAPQRGRRAGRAVGRLAQARPRRRHEDRRVLGRLAARAAACGRLRRRGWRTRRAASSTARRSSRRGSSTPTSAAPA